MVAINRQWWEHLAPKPMHKRRSEIDALLTRWCSQQYGAWWLAHALKPNAVIRVSPGQIVPVVHMIALGNRPAYIAPPSRVRVGDRTVGPDEFLSGKPLVDGELALEPTIRLDIVRDPQLLGTAARLEAPIHVPGVKEPSIVFSVPARLLLAPTLYPKKSFVLYQHIFGEGPSYPDNGFFYVGVTTRDWQVRWAEHRRAVKKGSQLLFHRRLREETDADRLTYIHHKVMAVTDDLEALYASEEYLVEGHWTDARRLNMIPGGKSGLRYLREHGMLKEANPPRPDERDQIVATWLQQHPRKGLPAPWLVERWKDSNWAIAQICSREDRLSVAQVRAIRELVVDHDVAFIAERIGARSVEQVQRVLDGKTYARVD
ncbi:hypothetical protein [Sphingobium yanoikuyae]|jgi:hypothetical protein|uniref:hypothetical protein n=1 Tax=Sphingobium yanoikuyae TaxID=13690 RepID=UPI001376C03F|nr:hypothetical protein [Sphingobium yanoikuyae]KAK0346260.1 hypothetical protein LTR94_007387 [Friedmanniomyces endolithicus]NBB39136.1 hypothetical protein [Sphingobium yanoikuyae]